MRARDIETRARFEAKWARRVGVLIIALCGGLLLFVTIQTNTIARQTNAIAAQVRQNTRSVADQQEQNRSLLEAIRANQQLLKDLAIATPEQTRAAVAQLLHCVGNHFDVVEFGAKADPICSTYISAPVPTSVTPSTATTAPGRGSAPTTVPARQVSPRVPPATSAPPTTVEAHPRCNLLSVILGGKC